MTKIVKIQTSQFSSGPGRSMLIYDQSRQFYVQLPLTTEVLGLMKGRPKAYFEAKIDLGKARNIQIIKEVDPQPW